MRNARNKGVSLVEVVIASSIITLTLTVLVTVYSLVARFSISNVYTLKATQLVEEGVEVLGYMRDAGYTANISSLSNGTTYRLYWNGTSWTVRTVPTLLENRYDVTFVLSAVCRDSSFAVGTCGGIYTTDTGSRKAIVSVAWKEKTATTTKSIETYLFNTFKN